MFLITASSSNPLLLIPPLQIRNGIHSSKHSSSRSLFITSSSPVHQPKAMASLILSRSRPLFSLTLGLGLSSLYATQALYRQKPLLCEASGATPLTTVSESFKTYSQDAKVPVSKDGRSNPQAYRQISAGSILGTLHSSAWHLWGKSWRAWNQERESIGETLECVQG